MSKQAPVRTCIGCRRQSPQPSLVRFGGGRGAYLCPAVECFEAAVKRKAFARALKREVGQREINDFQKKLKEQIANNRSPTAGSGGSGSC